MHVPTATTNFSSLIQQMVDEENVHHENMISKLESLKECHAEISYKSPSGIVGLNVSQPQNAMTTNNKQTTIQGSSEFDENNYHIILNPNICTLKLKYSPENKSGLEQGSLAGIGSIKMKILVWMLQNPGTPISYATAPGIYGHPNNICEPGAFAQTIRLLRRALGGRGRENPYIRTVPNYEPGKFTHGCAYVMNPAYRYLVVKRKISFENHS